METPPKPQPRPSTCPAKVLHQGQNGPEAKIHFAAAYDGTSLFRCDVLSMLMADLRVMFSHEQISRRVRELASAIERDFAGQSVIFIGVLKGASIFLSDLARSVRLDATFDFIGVTSYGNNDHSSGEVRLTKDVEQPLMGRNIILVEDILDTGLTLTYLKKLLLAHQPGCLKVAALLDKESRRVQPVKADYVGFTIPDEFVVGYGMDYAERYRNLPDICVLPPEML
jgi:hypoxanthine phosphoribosyltransferase